MSSDEVLSDTPAPIISGLEILADEMRPLCAEDFERVRRYFVENRGPSFPIMDMIQAPPPGNQRMPFWSDLEPRTFNVGDVEITVSFRSPPCETFFRPAFGGAEGLFAERVRRGIQNREVVLGRHGDDYATAVESHYRTGTKHPDDFCLPLNLWDVIDPI